jgi:flavodoxin
MKTLVIYDSVFGNTEKIAQSIAAALGTQAIPVSQADGGQLRGLDLLVVGSPTRGFRPTESISKMLNRLPKNHLAGVRVAAFDTRIVLETIDSKALRFIVDKGGYAASTIAKALEKKGGQLAAPGRASTSPASRGRSKTANSNALRTGRAG